MLIPPTQPEFDFNRPESPENPESPESPESPENPECPESPESPECPESPETPETPENPEPPAQFVVAPPSFNQMLQALRLEHGYTIHELSQKAHFPESVIVDLESGDVSRLNHHNNFYYCRAQIESICNAYKPPVSPEVILNAFDLAISRQTPSPAEEPLVPLDDYNEEPVRRLSAIVVSILIVLLLLLIVGGWIYKRYEIRRQERASGDYNLPALLPPTELPLTPLEIPTR